MKISALINHLTNTLKADGDLQVLIGDPQLARRAYDINRGDIKIADMRKMLVLVPNTEAAAGYNSAIITPGGENGQAKN